MLLPRIQAAEDAAGGIDWDHRGAFPAWPHRG